MLLFLANLYLYALEFDFLDKMTKTNIYIARKFSDSLAYLDKVYAFGEQFNSEHFINQCHIHYAWIAMLKGDIELGLMHLSKVSARNSKSVFVEMYFAHQRQDVKRIKQLYEDYKDHLAKPHRIREEALFDVILIEYGVIEYNEEQYELALERIIDIGTKGHDLELLNYGYTSLIELCKQRRKYKKALELSELARTIRNFGLS